MAMNRETKRMLQRQGAVGTDGATRRTERTTTVTAARKPAERTSPGTFVREVRDELRKVAWPTKSEVVNYTIVVLITVLVMTALIAGLDWLFGSAVLELFGT
jgi:preprotein translocase subunit SecE